MRSRVGNLPEEVAEGEAGQLTAGPVTHATVEQSVCGARGDIISFGGAEQVGNKGGNDRVTERGSHYFKSTAATQAARK